MKRDWRARQKEPIRLCALTQKVMDGRYVRWSWRYNSWQFEDKTSRVWRNIRPDLARALAAAGYRVGTGDDGTEPLQLDMFDQPQGENRETPA